MSQPIYSVVPTATIAGKNIPVNGFNVSNGAYGSVGRSVISTTISALRAYNIDLVSLTTAKASEIAVNVYVAFNGAAAQQLHGGEYIGANWNYDTDSVQIYSRDWSGLLVDQQVMLASLTGEAIGAAAPLVPGTTGSFSVNTQNQQLKAFVTGIASAYGLTPKLNLVTGNDPTIGSIGNNDDAIYTPVPQSLWAVLTQLALDTGYAVYTTPTKDLVFGLPGAGLTTLKTNYNSPLPPGAVPIRQFSVSHMPRRNSTFRVLVISYDPVKGQQGIGRATSIGNNLANLMNSSLGTSVSGGIVSADKALSADNVLASEAQYIGKIPLYTFYVDGYTQAQAQAKATAIAKDIARREFSLEFTLDGYPPILPTNPITLGGEVEAAFAAQKYFAISYNHIFTMPSRNQTSGFVTKVRALNFAIENGTSEATVG